MEVIFFNLVIVFFGGGRVESCLDRKWVIGYISERVFFVVFRGF